jgi:hypothetical protein
MVDQEQNRPRAGVAFASPQDRDGADSSEKEMLRRHQDGSGETPDAREPLSDSDKEKDMEMETPTTCTSSPPVDTNEIHRPPSRPTLQERATTFASNTSGQLPRLKRKETRMMQKKAHPMQHLGITLGLPAILIFDIVVPCIIYYTWWNRHNHQWKRQCRDEFNSSPRDCPIPKPEYDENILGYAIVSFGVGELWILIARVYRLFVHTADCAPLLSRNRWELDATSWVYGVAMILALIPFVVGSSLVKPHLYLYSPTFIMGFLGMLMLITELFPWVNIPIGINSQPRGTKLRPFIYYAAEDFIAVDGLQDREFRVRYNERYENNKAFRNMFRYLTWWWLLGVCVYIGAVSAVIWTLEFHYAFGLSLGVLFSYIAIWAAVSYVWVRIEIEREHRAFEKEESKPEA